MAVGAQHAPSSCRSATAVSVPTSASMASVFQHPGSSTRQQFCPCRLQAGHIFPGGKELEMTLAAPLLAPLANFPQMATLMQAALLERHKPNPHNIAVLTWLSSQRWSRPPFLSQKGNVLCSHCCTSRSISAAWLTRGPAQASSASPTDALSTETYAIVATQGKQDPGKLAESLHHGQNLPQPVSGPQTKHKRGQ